MTTSTETRYRDQKLIKTHPGVTVFRLPVFGAVLASAALLVLSGCSDSGLEALGRGLASGTSGTSATPSVPTRSLFGQWESFATSEKNVKKAFLFMGADKRFEFAVSLFRGSAKATAGRYDVVGNRINLFATGEPAEVLRFSLISGVLTITDASGNWVKMRK